MLWSLMAVPPRMALTVDKWRLRTGFGQCCPATFSRARFGHWLAFPQTLAGSAR